MELLIKKRVDDLLIETRHFIKTLFKQKVKTFFLSALLALNVKWVPPLKDYTFFFYKKNFYKKMSLKNLKTSRKC